MPVSKSLKNAQLKQVTIVQAAQDLFLENGYATTSMDMVAEQASVTKQTVYRYYPSKEDLFGAVMEKVRSDEPPLYQFGDADLQTELSNFARNLLAFHLTPAALGIYKLMLSEGGQENLRDSFMKAGPNRVMQALLMFLNQRCPRLDPVEFYAQMFGNMVLMPRNQLLMQNKKRFTRAQQETHVANAVALFLNGIQSN